MTEMLCKDCDAIVEFARPECDDSPDDDGELMCVICGTAISLGGMLLVEEWPRATAAA